MNAEITDIVTKLTISIGIGLIIGGEREYRNKSAGLRTIILICLGSTIFTMLSATIGDAVGASRIAANVVTGIGFLGAGAILREGMNISGLTTASTIWVAAALGIAVGVGEYYLAFTAMFLVFVVLTFFGYVQEKLFKVFRRTIDLHFTLDHENPQVKLIEASMNRSGLKFIFRKHTRDNFDNHYQYDVMGTELELKKFLSELGENKEVKAFNY
jgi:putative Mg2+ transporter-C (MgtC) family protein